MTVETPAGVQNAVETDAKILRRVTQSLAGGAVGAFAGGAGATNGAAHGICGYGHLAVTESGSPGMSVQVAAGLALITGTVSAEQGPYNVYNDAAASLSIAAADSTNPRRDLVIAQVRDSTYEGVEDDARITVVTGTPAGSPSDPSLSAHPNALVLARVEVAAGASSITNANITDLRTPAGRWAMPWGILPGGWDDHEASWPGFGTAGATIPNFTMTPTFLAGRMYRIKAIIHPDIGATATYATASMTVGSAGIVQANSVNLTAGSYTELNMEYVGPAPALGAQAVTVTLIANAGSVTSVGSTSIPLIMYAEDLGPA